MRISDWSSDVCSSDLRKVEWLTETLAEPETRLDSLSDIRSLVGKIVLHPGAKRGEIHATLHGSLMGILDFANDNPSPDASRVITSVASGSPGGRRREARPSDRKSVV